MEEPESATHTDKTTGEKITIEYKYIDRLVDLKKARRQQELLESESD